GDEWTAVAAIWPRRPTIRVKPIMLVAGDDAGRKPGVMALVGKLGFEPGDAGLLKNRCAGLMGLPTGPLQAIVKAIGTAAVEIPVGRNVVGPVVVVIHGDIVTAVVGVDVGSAERALPPPEIGAPIGIAEQSLWPRFVEVDARNISFCRLNRHRQDCSGHHREDAEQGFTDLTHSPLRSIQSAVFVAQGLPDRTRLRRYPALRVAYRFFCQNARPDQPGRERTQQYAETNRIEQGWIAIQPNWAAKLQRWSVGHDAPPTGVVISPGRGFESPAVGEHRCHSKLCTLSSCAATYRTLPVLCLGGHSS